MEPPFAAMMLFSFGHTPSALILARNSCSCTGGVPAGYYDNATSRYWTFTHKPQASAIATIRRAAHAGFTQQLSESDWTTVVSAATLGLSSTTAVESPGFAVSRAASLSSWATRVSRSDRASTAEVGACAALIRPSTLTATVVGTTVTLVWGGTGGATSYQLEVGASSGLSDIATRDTGSASTMLTAAPVAPGTYYMRVRARNECGFSATSNEVVVTVR